jgi:hypothetical protein
MTKKDFMGFYSHFLKRKLFVSVLLSLVTVLLLTQCVWAVPLVEWDMAFGGSGDDGAYSIRQTHDGGYIAAGYSWSNDGDVTGNHGKDDFWIIKLRENGTLVWQKSFGGSAQEMAYSIQETKDRGYIIAGESSSNDGDVTVNHGKSDFWVVKLKEDGTLEWQKSLGGSQADYASSIQQTRDGGYIVAGMSESNDGDVSENRGDADLWVVKLKEDGSLDWQKSLGGSQTEYGASIQQTEDGGYILAGISSSNDGDVSGNHGHADFWVVKLREDGAIVWQKSLGGSGSDSARYVYQTKDGGYVIAGESNSKDEDVYGNQGMDDLWVVKLKVNGAIEWQRSLGDPRIQEAQSIQQTQDGGYVIAGNFQKESEGRSTDCWVVKLYENGRVNWQRRFGGSRFDEAYSIQQTQDGGYIVAGYSRSDDGDVYKNQGGRDFWILKLEAE